MEGECVKSGVLVAKLAAGMRAAARQVHFTRAVLFLGQIFVQKL
jgi:hypothetical protein